LFSRTSSISAIFGFFRPLSWCSRLLLAARRRCAALVQMWMLAAAVLPIGEA
jgi:hypothetical protein